MRLLLLTVGLVAVMLTGCAARSVVPVQIGHTYIVSYDCLPEWVAQWASHAIANGQGLNPCYVEVLHIRQVSGTWMVGTDEQGRTWTINSARISGFQEQLTSAPMEGVRLRVER